MVTNLKAEHTHNVLKRRVRALLSGHAHYVLRAKGEMILPSPVVGFLKDVTHNITHVYARNITFYRLPHRTTSPTNYHFPRLLQKGVAYLQEKIPFPKP